MELGNPCNSAEQALTRLAHYCVDSGTAGLSHGSLREAIAFAINMRNAAVSTIDATFVTSIAKTAAAYGSAQRPHPGDEVGTVWVQDAGTCEGEDRCLRHRQGKRHATPGWGRCIAPISAI